MNSMLRKLADDVMGERNARMFARWIELRDPRYRASMRRIERYQNVHAGKRCFILGNGPSLNRTDLSLLKGEFTFGSNRIYLHPTFRPSYFVCANDLVVQQCAKDIEALDMPKFIGWHNRDAIHFTRDMMFLHTRGGLRSWFFTDLTEGCWEGSTVTMVSMQIAYYMGFSEVFLIGVDHSYACAGKPHEAQQFTGDDPNHFSPDYFKGFKWHLPDLEGSEMSYRVAKFMFEQSGRRICDATVGGKLTIFPKVDYACLFEKDRRAAA